MSSTARLIEILGLLQWGRPWPGSELAARLGVTPRTIRRDMDRLRELGYPVEGELGVHGGYRLVAGTAMPPLLLDDEEAVAIAVGLRTLALAGIPGLEGAGLRALAKLGRSLPSHLRARVEGYGALTTGWDPGRGSVDTEVLAILTTAASRGERVRMRYEGRDGTESRRHIEPLGVALQHRRWYLLAFDLDRGERRTFRVDRVREPRSTGVLSQHRMSAEEVAAELRDAALELAPVVRADVTLRLDPDAAARLLRDDLGDGTLRPEPAADPESREEPTTRTRWISAEDTVEWLALRLLQLDAGFTVHGPPVLLERLARIRESLDAALPL